VFNFVSTVVSLLGFTAWLFHSPHTSNVAVDLDRTCTSPCPNFFFLPPTPPPPPPPPPPSPLPPPHISDTRAPFLCS
jgi:hypothetical protein